MDLKPIKALCHEFNTVRGELRITVAKSNLSALRAALAGEQYGIASCCEAFNPAFLCIRAI